RRSLPRMARTSQASAPEQSERNFRQSSMERSTSWLISSLERLPSSKGFGRPLSRAWTCFKMPSHSGESGFETIGGAAAGFSGASSFRAPFFAGRPGTGTPAESAGPGDARELGSAFFSEGEQLDA